jgi:hypothetical protein
MKLFLLETPDLWLPDEINLMFVRAEDEITARHIARVYAKAKAGSRFKGDGKDEYVEAWINPDQATCEEIPCTGRSEVIHHVCGYN